MKPILQLPFFISFFLIHQAIAADTVSLLTIHGQAGGLAQEVAMYFQKVLPKKASSEDMDSYANNLLEGRLYYSTTSQWGEFEVAFTIDSKKSEIIDQSRERVRIIGDIAAEFMYILSADPIDFPQSNSRYRKEFMGGNFTCVEQGTIHNSDGESNYYYCDLYLTADKILP